MTRFSIVICRFSLKTLEYPDTLLRLTTLFESLHVATYLKLKCWGNIVCQQDIHASSLSKIDSTSHVWHIWCGGDTSRQAFQVSCSRISLPFMSIMHECVYVMNEKHLRVRTGLSVSKSQILNVSENEPNGAAHFILYNKKKKQL